MAMQAFGGPFGPVIAPQMPEGTDVTTPFLTGAQMAMQNNAKQRALENQAQLYALKLQNMEHERTLDWARYGISAQRLQQDAEQKGRMYELAVTRGDIAEQLANARAIGIQNRLNIAQQQVEAKSGTEKALGDLEAAGVTPGDPTYLAKAYEALRPYAGRLPNPVYDQMISGINARHDKAASNMWRMFNLDKTTLDRDVGGTVGYDANLQPMYEAIYNPATVLKPNTRGLFHPKPVLGEDGQPTYIAQIKDASGNTKPSVVTTTQLNALKQRNEDLETHHDMLPGFSPTGAMRINNQDIDVNPQAAQLHQRSLEVRRHPERYDLDTRKAAEQYLQTHPY